MQKPFLAADFARTDRFGLSTLTCRPVVDDSDCGGCGLQEEQHCRDTSRKAVGCRLQEVMLD